MKNLIKTIFASAVILLMMACNNNGVINPKVLRLNQQQEEMLQVSNDFSFNLLREVAAIEEKENIVLSPLSASIMLGMVMNGADGETLKQMKQALGFKDYPIEDINDYYNQLIDALPELDKTNKLKIANSIWVQQEFPIYDSFKNINKEYFYAKVDNVDFQSSGKVVQQINRWAAQNTNNLIKEVIKENEITDQTIMILANALYFKGIWKEKFTKSDTQKRDFRLANGKTVAVDMMQQTEEFRYADVEGGKLLEMDYKEGKYCMDILLPKEGITLKQMISKLNAEQWNQWMGNMRTYEVDVRIPKIEVKYDTNLTDPLKSTGMDLAFNPMAADFSKMSEIGLYLRLVKQFCYMKVDEEGTEAAAVTWGVMDKATAAPFEPKTFYADRPYLMVIREKQYGTILFTAAIGNPQ